MYQHKILQQVLLIPKYIECQCKYEKFCHWCPTMPSTKTYVITYLFCYFLCINNVILVKTRSVDLTITNILEGHVSYLPEQSKPSSSSSSSSNSPLKSTASSSSSSTHQATNTTLNTAVPVFGKSPQERSLSFQERKKLLIENSRKRYIEKHGLNNIVGS